VAAHKTYRLYVLAVRVCCAYGAGFGPSGPLLELFALDSNCQQQDGTNSTSLQGMWLQQALQDSKAVWKFVMLHHSPYSSGADHGSNPRMQW
jgi:hypothetical protein